jgi:DNA-binding MarR family transcriptional regulator
MQPPTKCVDRIHPITLVQAEEDPRERRRKIISLTPKGHELIATLREMMQREPRHEP